MEEDIIKFVNPYWSDKLKVEYLQRRVIVHSILYYMLDNSVISDIDYDKISRQLIRYMKMTSEEELKDTHYWYCMHDFDGNTGYDLYDRLTEVDKDKLFNISMIVLRSYQEYSGEYKNTGEFKDDE